MKKQHLIFIISIFMVQLLFSQEFKVDSRMQMEKEDPMKIHNTKGTTMLDLLEVIEFQEIKINKFELGKFDKYYKILLLADEYDKGKLIKTDTLTRFESKYIYYESKKPYYDFIDRIKIITKDSDNKSTLFIKTYSFSTKKEIELKRSNKYSFFNWRSYTKTEWKLNEKIPLMVFASSWSDKKHGVERFCGVRQLTENEEDTNELLKLSPHYIQIYYRVKQ